AGESERVAAVRELEEETGLRVTEADPLVRRHSVRGAAAPRPCPGPPPQ
ncbi:NUDIX domain-containing protein, partial [Nocardioides sp. NPDC057577]